MDGSDPPHPPGTNTLPGFVVLTNSVRVTFTDRGDGWTQTLPQGGMLLLCQPVGYSKR